MGNNQEKNSLTLETARRLLDWYHDPSRDQDVIRKLLPAQVLEAVFNLRGGVNFPLFFRRQADSADFAGIQRALLGKWWSKRNSMAAADAQKFLMEFAELGNHAHLFEEDISIGLTRAKKGTPASDYVTSYHSDRIAWTLHMSVVGSADYFADNLLRPGNDELLLIAPNASMHYKRSDTANEWQHYWALFKPEPSWFELMEWPVCSYGVYRLVISDKQQQKKIKSLFREMIDLYEDPPELMPRLLRNLLEQVLIRACESLEPDMQRKTDARVIKACQYIEENVSDNLSVANVAEHCNLSESRLSHLFKYHLNQSVKSFLDSVRIQHAKRLLVTTNKPIALIGASVGYEDPAQFSKFFTRKINCSPRDFRVEFGEAVET